MNDSNFSNYESYFCGNTFQDLSATHIAETEQPNTLLYFNSIVNELQQTQQVNAVHQLQFSNTAAAAAAATQQNSIQHNIPQQQQPQQHTLLGNSSNNNHGSNVNNNNSNNVLNNLPFVQIHTTDVHPPRSSYGNVFRRHHTNQEEIKSEPIKSESADSNTKDPSNTTPTPPNVQGGGNNQVAAVANVRQQPAAAAESGANEANVQHVANSLQHTLMPPIYKCTQCFFISLSESGVQQHLGTGHIKNACYAAEQRLRIECPGCDNVFHAHKSFYVHLCEDHRMCPQEANKLLQAASTQNSLVSTESSETQPKIFLKNVECLRAPRCASPEQQQQLQLNDDNNYFQMHEFDDDNVNDDDNGTAAAAGCVSLLADVCAEDSYVGIIADRNLTPPNTTKQKISIKSVDVLREPALLRRDFEIQNLNFLSQCNEHELHATLGGDSQYALENENDSQVDKPPRRPKIYIKNVDILKEPLVLPSTLSNGADMDFSFIPQSTGSFLNNVDSIAAQTQQQQQQQTVYEANGAPLSIGSIVEPFLYDGSSTNFLQNIAELDTFSLASGNTFALDSPKYQTPLQTLDGTQTTPMVTELTPPPASLPALSHESPHELQLPMHSDASTTQPKQKIFIKNVDILKQPQFQEHRRTLHLRTVDELNLMNKTEVENLIAPNLDAAQSTMSQSVYGENNNNNELNNLNNSTENSKNSAEEESVSFGGLNLKINENEVHALHSWSNDYSLGEDLDCIITQHTVAQSAEAQKHLYDLDTPQMSVISIRDLEEINDEQQQQSTPYALLDNQMNSNQQDLLFSSSESVLASPSTPPQQQQQQQHGFIAVEADAMCEAMQPQTFENNEVSCSQNLDFATIPNELKHEQSNANSETPTPVTEKSELIFVSTSASPALSEASVQAPSNCTFNDSVSPPREEQQCATNAPASALTAACTSSRLSVAPEKGRIYVADNLMEVAAERCNDLDRPMAVSITGGTSNRGRPFGSNRTGITKIRKLYGNAAAIDVGMKCNVQGCAFRFKKPETLDYHKRCHTSSNSTSATQTMICPECQSTNFSNWNTLHTHLWRSHQVDMELYSCELCQFKTPIYSRLVNTHSKIHSEERNYKCDQCEKAFKNSKQLKNHRRWHRNATTSAITTTATQGCVLTKSALELHRCADCGSAFSHQKTLREHICKETGDAKKVMRCDICARVVSSKSSLKLHMLTHEEASRFKCGVCDYRANDHNAFRRHRMTHDKSKMYICPYCDYKSIQSVAYQKHIQQKHPESADNIVLKCNACNFATINRSLLNIHMAKHAANDSESTEPQSSIVTNINSETSAAQASSNKDASNDNETESMAQVPRQRQPNKIKVKSDLLLTDPTKFSKNTNANSVTSMLAQCFDNAIT